MNYNENRKMNVDQIINEVNRLNKIDLIKLSYVIKQKLTPTVIDYKRIKTNFYTIDELKQIYEKQFSNYLDENYFVNILAKESSKYSIDDEYMETFKANQQLRYNKQHK